MPEYTKAVRDWPVPNTRTQVRAFLGKVGYYRRFIKGYSSIAAPLMVQLNLNGSTDKEEFTPSPEFTAAFDSLKDKLLQAPILAYPQFDSPEPFILDTDWSAENNAVGAVLSQVQNGLERVICYGGKRLSKSQAGYTSTKGELAGAIIFMTKWRYFLQYRPFILRIDNRSLQWIYTMVQPKGMTQRWLEILANFTFTVEHRAGTAHGNADGLSRAAHLPPADDEADVSMGECLAALHRIPLDKTTLLNEQEGDADIGPILLLLRAGQQPKPHHFQAASRTGKLYLGLFASLSIDENGLLSYAMYEGTTKKKSAVILPRNLWSSMLQQVHEDNAHMAAASTVAKALKSFYFPGMLAYATTLLSSCIPCQRKLGKTKDQRHTLAPSWSGYPFQKLSLDFVGPLPSSAKGLKYLLTIQDTFSRWLEAFPIRAANAATVVNILTTEIFPRFGLCEQLHSDRGSQFTGDLLSAVANELSIKHTQTPAYNPKSNPVERAHRTLKSALTALTMDHPHRWPDYVPQALFAMRTAVCRSTGFAPFELLFGRDPTTNLDLLFRPPGADTQPLSTSYAQDLRSRILQAHEWARRNIGAAIKRQRNAYVADKTSLATGSAVWLFTPTLQLSNRRKFSSYWTGPWTVAAQLNDVMYRLEPDSSWLRKGQLDVSVDRLKPYTANHAELDANVQPPADADLNMPGDEYAEFLQGDEDDDDHTTSGPADFPLPPAPALPALPPPAPAPAGAPLPPAAPAAGAAAGAAGPAAQSPPPSPPPGPAPDLVTPPGRAPPPLRPMAPRPPGHQQRRHDGYTARERYDVLQERLDAAARRLQQRQNRADRAARRDEQP